MKVEKHTHCAMTEAAAAAHPRNHARESFIVFVRSGANGRASLGLVKPFVRARRVHLFLRPLLACARPALIGRRQVRHERLYTYTTQSGIDQACPSSHSGTDQKPWK